MQFQQRLTHQGELLGHHLEAIGIATRQGRPGLGRRGDALARLDQHRRVETAILRRLVVDGFVLRQAIRLPDRSQHRGGLGIRRCRLGTEEQQILGQAVRHFGRTLGQSGVLHQHARSRALDIDIRRAKLERQGLEVGRADLPEGARIQRLLAGCQPQADVAQGLGRGDAARLDHLEHSRIQLGTHGRVITQCFSGHGNVGIDPAPGMAPEFGRMHALLANQLQHVAVLREQGHRRSRLAAQHTFQVFDQGKAGTLDLGGGVLAASLGAFDKLLRQGLHGAQHLGRLGQAHHLEGTDSLV